MNNKTKFSDFLETLTVDQAIQWQKTNEKILFVDDDILAPNDFRLTDFRLSAVEQKFESLLSK